MRKIVYALMIVLMSFIAFAAPTVAWDPNPPEEQVTQYQVHWGSESRVYPNSVPVVSGTEYTFADGTFLPGSITYIAVTAHNAAGLSSDYSDEVILDLTGPEFNPPSVPTNVSITATRNPDGSVTVIIN